MKQYFKKSGKKLGLLRYQFSRFFQKAAAVPAVARQPKTVRKIICVCLIAAGCCLSSSMSLTRAAEPPQFIEKSDGGNTSSSGVFYNFSYQLIRKSYDRKTGTAVYKIGQYFSISGGSIPVYSDKVYLTNRNGTNVYIGEFSKHNGNAVGPGTFEREQWFDLTLVEGNNKIVVKGQFSGNDSGDVTINVNIDKFGNNPVVHGTDGTWVSGEVASGKRTNESLFTDGAAGSAAGNKTQTSTGFSYTDADEQTTATYRYSGTTLGNNARIENIKKNGTVVSFSSLNDPGTYVVTSCTTDSAQNKACGSRNIVVKSKYSVKYNGNHATSGSMSNSAHVYDTAKKLTNNAFARTGYHFDHWNTKADNSGTSYTNQQSVKNLTSVNDGVVNLYAQWEPNTYTIKYHGNAATSGSMSDSTHTYDTAKALNTNKYARSGWKFVGWNTKADGTGTSYTNQQSVKNLTSVNNGTINLYAMWNQAPSITAVNKTYYENEHTQYEWITQLRMQQVSANDLEDGNLTNAIKIIEDPVEMNQVGVYDVVYEVTDSVNQTIRKSVQVTIKYNHPPVIEAPNRTFYENEYTSEEWKSLRKEAVTASDEEDGNLTDQIEIIKDTVNLKVAGTYEVAYRVFDQYGKSTVKNTSVTVKYNNPPTITAENRTYYLGEITQAEWNNTLRKKDVSAHDVEDGNLSDHIKITLDEVDTTTAGVYRVIYEVSDQYGKTCEKLIYVEMLYNHVPLITAENLTIHEGEYSDKELEKLLKEQASANDEEDGDLTAALTIIKNEVKTDVPGAYEVTYEVTDSFGNTTTKTIDVTVLENRKPTLQLFTANKRFIEGQYTQKEWEEQLRMKGVTAYDQEDKDLTEQIEIVSDTTNPLKRGSYVVTYRVSDRWGKSETKQAKVTVEPNEAPIIYANDRYFKTTDIINDKLLLRNVYASDDHDGNISSQVKVEASNVKSGVAGVYDVEYEVSDSLGKKGYKTVKVTIAATPAQPGKPQQPSDPDVLYWWNGKEIGSVNVTKLMETSSIKTNPQAYQQVTFGIYAKEDIIYQGKVVVKAGSLVAISKVDEAGQLHALLYHKGSYYLQELATDGNYVLDDTQYAFTYR